MALNAKIFHLKGNFKLSKQLLDKLKLVAGHIGTESRKKEEKKKIYKIYLKKDEMKKKKAPGHSTANQRSTKQDLPLV